MQIEVGEVLEGTVTGIAAFGAFVELPNSKTGLVHISEVSAEYVSDVKDHIKEGQKVKVKVIGVDKGKISLSIKQVSSDGSNEKKERNRGARNNRRSRAGATNSHRPPEEFVPNSGSAGMSFDDMLLKFKQDSDEKFQDLKRSNDSKRSGGYKRSY